MTYRTVGIFTVRSALAALCLCAGLLAGCKGQSEQAAAPQGFDKPRLVLQITVDQFRGDLPTRYADRLGEGGLRYLLEEGIHYNNAHHAHAVYSSDMRLVREVLEKTAREYRRRLQDKDPAVLLIEFGSSSVDWEVSVWLDDPWIRRQARSELNQEIWWALLDAGITIAFPQLDVHFDEPVVQAIQRVS